MQSTSSFLSGTSLADEIPGAGLMIVEFLWRTCLEADGKFRGSLSPHLLFFSCLQLKIIFNAKEAHFSVA